jgi:hypothetical protein
MSPQFTSLAAALAVATMEAAVIKAEEYRAKAQECDERAVQVTDIWAKQQFQECAKQWRRFAERVERKVYER